MSALPQRLLRGLLAIAVRRWPSHLRETMALEWAAELHALAVESAVPQPIRAWRQMRFAASLAASRPSGGGHRIPVPGRMRWPARLWEHAICPACAPLLAMLAAQVPLISLQLIPFGRLTITPTSSALLTAQSYAVLAAAAMVIGTLLGRRLLRSRSGQPLSPAQRSWMVLPVLAGLEPRLAGPARSRPSNIDNDPQWRNIARPDRVNGKLEECAQWYSRSSAPP